MTRPHNLELTAIVAMTHHGVIGDRGDMPWRLSSDLRRFKRLTLGGTLLMGRRTYESIGRPLPGRRTIVITRNPQWHARGVDTAVSPEAALDMLTANVPAFVVGGAEIYRQMLPYCRAIWQTRVWSNVEGDTRLELDLSGFYLLEHLRQPASVRDDVPTELFRWVRCPAAPRDRNTKSSCENS